MRAGRDLRPRVSSSRLQPTPTYFSKISDGLVELFGEFDSRQGVAEEHGYEEKSIEEGGEDGDGISVEDERGQNRVCCFTHGIAVSGSDRICR